MKGFKLSLMGWILIGLTVVGLLPFAITAYQISSNQKSLIEQMQQTHLITVRASADRISSYLELLDSIANSAAKNPNLFQDPKSTSAQEILIGILRSRSEIVSASIVQHSVQNTDPLKLVQAAHNKEYSAAAKETLANNSLETYQLVNADNSDWLLVTHPLEAPNLSLRLLAKRQQFTELLAPKEMEEAEFSVFERDGTRLTGLLGTFTNFPEAFQQQIKSPHVRSSAAHFNFADGTRAIASFAEIPDANWIVVSRQPAVKAELVTQNLLQQTLIAFAFVLFVALGFAWAARRKVVEPIRELISAQQQLAGIDLKNIQGNEIEQLKVAFAQLEHNINARQALDKMFLGRYQVIEEIASGAMGTVFKGFDPRLERTVALKTIKIGKLRSEFNRADLAKQLVKEAKLVAKLPHPNIVTVYDAVDAGESALVAMEFINGMSLAEYINDRPTMPANQVIALSIGMLRGLGAAHKAGIIHRDIKPGNILLGYDGGIKLTDFGIADLISKSQKNDTGMVMGTPGYVAPELLEGGGYTARSDLFAMGALMYRCAAHTTPFKGNSVKQILQNTISIAPPSPHDVDPKIPDALSNAIMLLLQKEPKRRPSDADIVADALEQKFGVMKWLPPRPENTFTKTNIDSNAETRMLPETVIRKRVENLE